ncbi:hypoxanthine-guanine phosphoribosyltransferase [Spiroplasma helicoides]|uniref:Hypoxanthine-guanine phosphoribosyltransferase n=1 Tax=Spiroplasma helicoides TaxID=216938 RepID=A0A1B3SMB6_9MOLU|nr:phosphoribosyltransferase family protein [Spiroplasma helicoides]AOG61079.1 hypoxanthine-guanine phosphoribosyltransferase [Spiroplasma helicoides]
MTENRQLITLIAEDEIKAAIVKAASEYAKMYENEQLTIVAELSSTFVFVADLIRELPIDVTIQFITKIDAIEGATRIDLGLSTSLHNKNVLIVSDVLYKGRTLQKIYDIAMQDKPKDVRVITLIEKKNKDRELSFEVDALFKIEDVFIVGYGLTYNESYRGLKGIYSLSTEGEQ